MGANEQYKARREGLRLRLRGEDLNALQREADHDLEGHDIEFGEHLMANSTRNRMALNSLLNNNSPRASEGQQRGPLPPEPVTRVANNVANIVTGLSANSSTSPEEQVIRSRGRRECKVAADGTGKATPTALSLAIRRSPRKPVARPPLDLSSYFLSPTPKRSPMKRPSGRSSVTPTKKQKTPTRVSPRKRLFKRDLNSSDSGFESTPSASPSLALLSSSWISSRVQSSSRFSQEASGKKATRKRGTKLRNGLRRL